MDDYQYEKIRRTIYNIHSHKDAYRFNVIGMFIVPFHLQVKRKNYFYCAEFVKYIFDISNIEIDLPEIVRPMDFDNIVGFQEIYSGILREYKI